jgi:transposase
MINRSKNQIAELLLQFIPVNQPGARRRICLITVMQFILHKLKTGCQWRLLYADIDGVRPAFSWQTVYRYFRLWV